MIKNSIKLFWVIIMIDLYKIKFLRDNDKIEDVFGGHSGALIYKIIRDDKNYFIKIFKDKYSENKIRKCKEIIQIYNKIDVKTLEIIDYGIVKELDGYYIVYNFIEGKCLKDFTNTDEYSLEDVRMYGKYIGEKMLKLKNYKEYSDDLFKFSDIKFKVDTVIYNYFEGLKDKKINEIVTKRFSINDLNILKSKLEKYSKLLYNMKPGLINGDIKRSNIMVDSNKEIYIVDIESMKVDFDVMNFRHQMTWSLFNGNEKETYFVKGYFDGLYGNTRPKDFDKFVIFIMIFNFFEASYKMFKKSKFEKLEKYIEDSYNMFKNDYYKKVF